MLSSSIQIIDVLVDSYIYVINIKFHFLFTHGHDDYILQ